MQSTYKPVAYWAMHVAAELAGLPKPLRDLLPCPDSFIPQALRDAICESQDWLCMYCGVDLRRADIVVNIDHMRPTSRGGPSFGVNLQGLCETCNKRKSNKTDGECRRIYVDVMPGFRWWQPIKPPRFVIDQQVFKDTMDAKDNIDWQFGPRHGLNDTATLLVLWFRSHESGAESVLGGILGAKVAINGKIRDAKHRMGAISRRVPKLALKTTNA